ncbi:hypothetical protein [Streptomyces sp. MUM 178J]|uniref:hypothetical protein n=1 Tax=Streptomyces sp. MUM 178J TaxID=2791991 RepID=UPI001F042444|nr:hypothetical protein [Streptomyces sp. MUM 178J]WRQ79828.1 hypothetical protein I3F59_010980 [Streptomyces sp. MUM 178J]
MSESTGAAGVRESYAFACMGCGHGWEQSYEIEHHSDPSGKDFVVYRSGGRRVPSPLSRPNCTNCGGHVIRIMKAGQVSSAALSHLFESAPDTTGPVDEMPVSTVGPLPTSRVRAAEPHRPASSAASAPAASAPEASRPETQPELVHWHLSALLKPFQGRKRT